jgi:glycosyltransferase involved in cell wall biosynthesis
MAKGVSVIICCYNSASKIEQTLFHLSSQTLTGINCEILLIDNNSTDNTSDVANQFWGKHGNTSIKLTTLHEPSPGLANARLKGVKNAMFDILVFCDDDNWLDKDYLINVIEIFDANPGVGVAGGIGSAQFENQVSKPDWFDNFSQSFAIGDQGDSEGLVSGVYGAGMAMRRDVAINCVFNTPFFLSGRSKKKLSAGDDAEMCFRTRLSGYKIYWSPRLTFQHYLVHNRLKWENVKKLHTGFASSFVIINLYKKALTGSSVNLSSFYWLKQSFYYGGIFLKYWPKQFKAYKDKQGTVEEIRHLMWKRIALDYLNYNFKTLSIFKNIQSLTNLD